MGSARRRRADPNGADHREERTEPARLRPFNGHTRWVVGVVSTAIVTALGTLALIDRNRIETKADLAAATATATSVAVVMERVSQIQASLEEIKELLHERERETRHSRRTDR